MKIILITSIEALKNRKVKVSSVVSQTLEKSKSYDKYQML